MYALFWESVNVSPASSVKSVGVVDTEEQAKAYVSDSPSIFIRRYYIKVDPSTRFIFDADGKLYEIQGEP